MRRKPVEEAQLIDMTESAEEAYAGWTRPAPARKPRLPAGAQA
jgi:hypothetical protein